MIKICSIVCLKFQREPCECFLDSVFGRGVDHFIPYLSVIRTPGREGETELGKEVKLKSSWLPVTSILNPLFFTLETSDLNPSLHRRRVILTLLYTGDE